MAFETADADEPMEISESLFIEERKFEEDDPISPTTDTILSKEEAPL